MKTLVVFTLLASSAYANVSRNIFPQDLNHSLWADRIYYDEDGDAKRFEAAKQLRQMMLEKMTKTQRVSWLRMEKTYIRYRKMGRCKARQMRMLERRAMARKAPFIPDYYRFMHLDKKGKRNDKTRKIGDGSCVFD
jgi:hypothetical protein